MTLLPENTFNNVVQIVDRFRVMHGVECGEETVREVVSSLLYQKPKEIWLCWVDGLITEEETVNLILANTETEFRSMSSRPVPYPNVGEGALGAELFDPLFDALFSGID